MRLENWSVQADPDPYKAPEMKSSVLVGEVHGHPTYEDGSVITTSPIKSSDGWEVTTHSGSVYRL